MGRDKLRHLRRETRDERIHKKIAVRVMVEQSKLDLREQFIDAFGHTMTQAERDEYMRTGIFEGTDDDGIVPEPIRDNSN